MRRASSRARNSGKEVRAFERVGRIVGEDLLDVRDSGLVGDLGLQLDAFDPQRALPFKRRATRCRWFARARDDDALRLGQCGEKQPACQRAKPKVEESR
jgi:hypothetical protein